jgi:hypothetical protein
MLLECAIEQAKLKKRNLTICWLDLANAFGSLPHDFLYQLFSSLPIPDALRNILRDIYSDNIFEFFVRSEIVSIRPTSVESRFARWPQVSMKTILGSQWAPASRSAWLLPFLASSPC